MPSGFYKISLPGFLIMREVFTKFRRGRTHTYTHSQDSGVKILIIPVLVTKLDKKGTNTNSLTWIAITLLQLCSSTQLIAHILCVLLQLARDGHEGFANSDWLHPSNDRSRSDLLRWSFHGHHDVLCVVFRAAGIQQQDPRHVQSSPYCVHVEYEEPPDPTDCYYRRRTWGKLSTYLVLCNYTVHSWHQQMLLRCTQQIQP